MGFQPFITLKHGACRFVHAPQCLTIYKIHTMPKIAEFANHILGIVADELDVPKDSILSKSRTAEVVDARHLAIKLLHQKDIYTKRIAEIFGMSPRSVHYVITSFESRLQTNAQLRSSYQSIKSRTEV